MPTSIDSSSILSSETDVNEAHEYYEELDNQTLALRKRKEPILTKSFVKEPPPVVDPIRKLNEQLNRQFRPDLVPTSTLPLSSESINKRAPDPLIFDARAKRVKSSKKNKEPSASITQKLSNRMSNQQTTVDGFQVPPGMMLVPAPQQQQQQSFPRTIEPSQQPTVSQYKPPTVTYSNSFKNNRIVPPPSNHNTQTNNHTLPNNSFQTPSSFVSTNELIQSSYPLQQQKQQQQHVFKHLDQSKSNKKKQKKQPDEDLSNINNANRSYALYNQKNGRIEGVVKNRLNIATDDIEESKIIDDETEPKGKCMLWLSQPLCLGLTRLSGGILFSSMILLGCAALGGLIASSVLYTQDSVTDAQWKILGMVVCAIMLITIIITLLIFICCYKQGYMFDKDDDIDAADPSTSQDAEGNERQKAVLRKIYKFNRPNETSPVPFSMPHHVTTSPPPPPRPQPSVRVNDKLTNTETTIAVLRPQDIDRGVWPSNNAYGGICYRPLIAPQMTSRYIQVLPHEIEETMQPQQIIYQVVAPTAAIPPAQIQQRIIQIPAPQTSLVELVEVPQKSLRTIQVPAQQPSYVEYVETTQKQQPRTIQIPAEQQSYVEYVETTQKQQPRTIQIPAQQQSYVEYVETTQKQQPRTIQVPAQQQSFMEYVETTQKQQPRTTIVRQPQTQQIIVQPQTHIEYVDAEEQRGRRIVQKPQYEIVEEVLDQTTSSPIEEMVEIVNAPKHKRHHGRKKEKKHGFGGVSVKHLKSGKE